MAHNYMIQIDCPPVNFTYLNWCRTVDTRPILSILPTASTPCKHESCIAFDPLCRIIVWDIENTKSIISHRGEFSSFDICYAYGSITCLINHTGHSDTVSSVATHPSSENCFISTSQVSINIECVCSFIVNLVWLCTLGHVNWSSLTPSSFR